MQQRSLRGGNAPRHSAAKLLCGDARLVQCLRGDEVVDGLGLREIEAAGEERALGELASVGEPRSERKRLPHDGLKHDRRAVRGDLYEVVASVRVWRKERRDDGVVDCCGPGDIVRIEHPCKARMSVVEWRDNAQQMPGDEDAPRPREPDNANAAAAGRRRNGDDGVGFLRAKVCGGHL